ncbi:MAG: BatD family protein [Candidatus Omnitrophica bacterium]|nr:BatD family protein [Candidatus Omnitrophota bacterium]
MKKKLLIASVFILLCGYPAFAETTIKAEIDKTSIVTGEALTYKLTVTSSEKRVPEPNVPKFENFVIVSQAQSSTLAFGKSDMQSILVYAYILAAPAAGKFRIEPATITIENKTYSTQDFWVDVKQGKSKGDENTPSQQAPNSPEKSRPESEEPQYTL